MKLSKTTEAQFKKLNLTLDRLIDCLSKKPAPCICCGRKTRSKKNLLAIAGKGIGPACVSCWRIYKPKERKCQSRPKPLR